MKTHWKPGKPGGNEQGMARDSKRRLLLFFTGWGMDETPTAHLLPPEPTWDICTCFHYEVGDGTIQLPPGELEKWRAYDGVWLVAWSMGVWAAEAVFKRAENALPNLQRAVAINGTPLPVDDRHGIPAAIAHGTLDGLTPATMERFLRRVFGGPREMKAFNITPPKLTESGLAARKEELRRIIFAAENSEPSPAPALRWNRAWVSTRDAIFPPENLRRYWAGRCEVRQPDAPHSLFHWFANWGDLLEEGINPPPTVLDKTLIRRRFARHLESYRRLAVMQRKIAVNLAEKWAWHFNAAGKPSPLSRLLEVGCGTGFLTREYVRRMGVGRLFLNDLVEEALPSLRDNLESEAADETSVHRHPSTIELLPGDAESVPFPANLDAVVSASTLQWFADLPRFFQRTSRALRDGGWLAFSTFGPGNLREIKALTGQGLCYPDLERLREMLEEQNFEILTLEEEWRGQMFARPRDVLRHLQQTGVTGAGADDFRWTPGSLRAFERDYAARYRHGGQVVLTWHVIYAVCQKRGTP